MRLRESLRAALPHGAILEGDAARPFGRYGGALPQVWAPGDAGELAACMRIATATGASVLPAGRGLRLGWGRPPERCDVIVSTCRLQRIRAHEPADMTLVVESGATLAQVREHLQANGQRLPIDPPFADQTTVGGLIATDVFGPLRAAHGKVRDSLIGLRAVLADGTEIKAGGRVVKNVAGYDLMKLFSGSFGTLGVIVEASFKLKPSPPSSSAGAWRQSNLEGLLAAAAPLRRLSFPLAMARVIAGDAEPLGADDAAVLVLTLEGSAAEIEAQRRELEATIPAASVEWLDDTSAGRLTDAARDAQAWGTGRDDLVGVRLSLPGESMRIVVPQALQSIRATGATVLAAGDIQSGTVFLRIHGPSDHQVATLIAALRDQACGAGGSAVVDDVPARLADRVDPWGEVAGLALMRGVKAALDPGRLLSPGRFVGGI